MTTNTTPPAINRIATRLRCLRQDLHFHTTQCLHLEEEIAELTEQLIAIAVTDAHNGLTSDNASTASSFHAPRKRSTPVPHKPFQVNDRVRITRTGEHYHRTGIIAAPKGPAKIYWWIDLDPVHPDENPLRIYKASSSLQLFP
jgi:hypothetical protein